ncbi:Acetyltransf_6 domain-containing protein [Pseudomonas sp. IT-P44]
MCANKQMNAYISKLIHKLMSPSMRFELRKALAWLGDIAARACVWRWEIARFKLREDSRYDILYVGRKSQREFVKVLLGAEPQGVDNLSKSDRTVVVSDMPSWGALYVPQYLSAVVPLRRSIDEITARYNTELRRNLRKNRLRYGMKQALNDDEIETADREMLQPYARARHGAAASQIASHEVQRVAKRAGRLDLVVLEDQVVACHLGCVVTRAGKRYWSTVRFGYPDEVFSDARKLREVNSITTFMALEWAIENGFDYYDIGTCLARPDDGLLEWKRRRGGDVDTLGNHGYVFVRLPRTGAAQFLWETPLFAVEGKHLTLHLGIPDGPSDEEVANRYREMGFGGLSKLYLHCSREPGAALLDNLRSRYAHLKSPPILQTVLCT